MIKKDLFFKSRVTPRTKIILAFVLSATIGIVIVVYFLHFSLLNSAIERWEPDNQFLIHALEDHIDNQIRSSVNTLVATSKQPAFLSLPYLDQVDLAINGIPEGLDLDKRRILETLRSDLDTFSVLFLLSPNGDHYISHPYSVQKGLTKFNLSERPYFIEARRTKLPVVSDSFVGAEGFPVVVIDVPILNEQMEIIAHLGGVYHLTKLAALVDAKVISPFSTGFIVDSKGKLIAHTDAQRLENPSREEFVSHPLVQNLLAGDGQTAQFVNPADNVRYLVSSTKLASGWSLALLRSETSIVETVRPQVITLSTLVLIILFCVGAVGVTLAAKISRRWEEAEDKLQDAHNRLEDRVVERTEELHRKEENLRTTLNSIGDAVIATDAEGRVTRMNPVAERLTGWTFDEAEGKLIDQVFDIVNAQTRVIVENPVEKVLASGEVVDLPKHTLLISKNGNEYQIADSGAPIHRDSGETVGVVLVFRDVSDEYTLQEQLRQSQRMDAIGQIAGGVAHDFNNMLTGIMGATELVGQYLPDDPKAREFHGLIIKSTHRAAELTQNLLAFARKQSSASSAIDAHQIIGEAVSLLKHTIDPRIKVKCKFSAEKSHVVGVPAQLQNAFLNLGINASHAMPEGGTIFVASRTIALDSTYCEASAFAITPGQFLEVTVRDTGCGISQDAILRIFEPFFTTKGPGKGTGLGLAAVYGTVQQHQGETTVHSKVGQGTTFRILLPLSQGEPVHQILAPQLHKGTGRILVVDDEAVIRITAQEILTDLGYDVVVAENGLHGLDIFEADPAAVDLVLLDMIMPEMNGPDCFAAMKKIRPDIRVIVASGFSKEKDIELMQAAGLSGLIAKPFRKLELSQIVHNVLKG